MAARSEASTRSDVSAPMNLHDFVIYIVVVEVEFLIGVYLRPVVSATVMRVLRCELSRAI